MERTPKIYQLFSGRRQLHTAIENHRKDPGRTTGEAIIRAVDDLYELDEDLLVPYEGFGTAISYRLYETRGTKWIIAYSDESAIQDEKDQNAVAIPAKRLFAEVLRNPGVSGLMIDPPDGYPLSSEVIRVCWDDASKEAARDMIRIEDSHYKTDALVSFEYTDTPVPTQLIRGPYYSVISAGISEQDWLQDEVFDFRYTLMETVHNVLACAEDNGIRVLGFRDSLFDDFEEPMDVWEDFLILVRHWKKLHPDSSVRTVVLCSPENKKKFMELLGPGFEPVLYSDLA